MTIRGWRRPHMAVSTTAARRRHGEHLGGATHTEPHRRINERSIERGSHRRKEVDRASSASIGDEEAEALPSQKRDEGDLVGGRKSNRQGEVEEELRVERLTPTAAAEAAGAGGDPPAAAQATPWSRERTRESVCGLAGSGRWTDRSVRPWSSPTRGWTDQWVHAQFK